jgi:hypothetical protein
VGAYIVYFNINFNILKQINFALIGLIKDWIINTEFKINYNTPKGGAGVTYSVCRLDYVLEGPGFEYH